MRAIATLADVEAAEARMPELPANTYEMIQRGASINPAAPALTFFMTAQEHTQPETWTYQELLEEITRAANFFHGLGVKRDSVIACVLPNLPETHAVIWGGEAAGIVFPINSMLEASAIAELLTAACVSVVVTLAPFAEKDLWQKVSAALASAACVKDVVFVDPTRRRGHRLPGTVGPAAPVPPHVRVHDFTASLLEQNATHLLPAPAKPYHLSSYFCTGGTTGLPKIAMRVHGNEVANAWSAAQVVGDGIGPGKTLFCGLPLFHVNAVLVTGLLPFSRGAHVVLGTPHGYRGEGVIQRFWEIVDRHRINFFSAVPTVYSALLQIPVGSHRLDSLEFGLCGAAPMPVELFRTFQEVTGVKIIEGYGLTEGTCVSSINPPRGERRVGSIGLRIPGQHMKTALLDEEGAYVRECATGEAGALLISGQNVFAGYKLEAQNRGLWINDRDGRRWLNTGDLARQDADGYFWLTGRKKELIIRGGHNIDPASIEAPLHRHPAVALAAAVGRPDAHAGELPVAYVQLVPGAKTSADDLTNFLKDHIAERAALPKHVRIIERMPLTAVGKIFKPALKARETADALDCALREAGVSIKRLGIHEDTARGLVVQAHLEPGASANEAHRVLGQFPFGFTVHSPSTGA